MLIKKEKMNYNLGITTGYFNDDTKDLKQSYLNDLGKQFDKYEVDSLIAEVVEKSEGHVSGVVSILFESKDVNSAKEYIEQFIRDNGLQGECWSLTEKGKEEVLATEE